MIRALGPNPYHRVVRERTLWERLAGDLLVIGAKRQAKFIVQDQDGAHAERIIAIPRSGVVSNDGSAFRIVSVPLTARHRILWVSGPSALSPGRLAAYAPIYPEVKRYLRRRRWRHFWLRLLGHV